MNELRKTPVLPAHLHLLVIEPSAFERDLLALLVSGADPLSQMLNAADFGEALDIAQSDAQIDLILIAECMTHPDMTGVRELRAVRPGTPVLVLGTNGDIDIVKLAFRAGACGVVPKNTRAQIMLNVIQLALAGASYVPEQVLADPAPGLEAKRCSRALTARENEVMQELLGGSSNKEIAHKLGLEEVTVSVHLSSIYRKLGVHSRTQAVMHALENGLK